VKTLAEQVRNRMRDIIFYSKKILKLFNLINFIHVYNEIYYI